MTATQLRRVALGDGRVTEDTLGEALMLAWRNTAAPATPRRKR